MRVRDYEHLFLIGYCDGKLPSKDSGFAAFFFFFFLKFKTAVAGSWYARWGPINPDKVSKVKGSNDERPKALRIFYDTSLRMYTIALLCISHLKKSNYRIFLFIYDSMPTFNDGLTKKKKKKNEN